MLNLPFLISVTTPKKLIFIFDFLKVNLILGWKPFSSFKNLSKFSSLSVHIKNISSMNRFHTHSFIDYVLVNSVSMKSMKIQSCGEGSKFSTSSDSTYLLEKFEIKLKNTFLKTFSVIFMIYFVGTFLCRNLLFVKNL